MRNQFSRIAGGTLLVVALFLAIFSPGKSNFSIIHFYFFLTCFTCGILLLTGMIGTHPMAAAARRAAIRTGARRNGPLCRVPEQIFPYAGSMFNRRMVAGICVLIGFSLTGLGFFIAWVLPSKGFENLLAGMPCVAAGILCLWISIRYPERHLRTTPESIMLKGYFRTILMPWQNIVALIAREHSVLIAGGFVSTGIIYSLYSEHGKLWFSSNLPGSERLASLVADATGLTWDSLSSVGNKSGSQS